MKREINFRGYSILLNKWVYGFLVIGDEKTYIVYNGFEDDYRYAFYNVFIEVDHKSVGQYTGLKDKNGVEIYEGDIVICTSRGIDFTGAVFFNALSFDLNLNDGFSSEYEHMFNGLNSDCKVIGNIYQNPELL